MAFSGRKDDVNAFDSNVETIDLTLSSPEPEVRRVIPRQSQLPTFFKKEGGVTKPKSKVSQSAASAPAAVSHQTRSANSVHIARLINSSNPEVLKTVLFELCHMSPALFGAIQRGLAIHSSGQNRVGQKNVVHNKGKFTTPQPRLQPHDMSQSHVAKGPSTVQRDALQRPHVSQPVPRIKRQVPVELSSPDSDSDDDLRVPGSFSRSTQRANPAKPALQDQSSTSTVNRAAKPLSLSERLARLQQETLDQSKRCGRCWDLFVREDDVCLYHPGRTAVLRGGKKAWTCCERHVNEIGCKPGKHIDQETYTGHRRSTYVKPAEQTKLCNRCHEPWTDIPYECYHHPGYKIKEENGQTIYSCCFQPLDSSGCEFGDHVDSERSFKRPSPSPDPFGMHQKKSKIF